MRSAGLPLPRRASISDDDADLVDRVDSAAGSPAAAACCPSPCPSCPSNCGLACWKSSTTRSSGRLGTKSRGAQGCLHSGQHPLPPLVCRKRRTHSEQKACAHGSSTGPWKKSPQIWQRRWLSSCRIDSQLAGHCHSSNAASSMLSVADRRDRDFGGNNVSNLAPQPITDTMRSNHFETVLERPIIPAS